MGEGRVIELAAAALDGTSTGQRTAQFDSRLLSRQRLVGMGPTQWGASRHKRSAKALARRPIAVGRTLRRRDCAVPEILTPAGGSRIRRAPVAGYQQRPFLACPGDRSARAARNRKDARTRTTACAGPRGDRRTGSRAQGTAHYGPLRPPTSLPTEAPRPHPLQPPSAASRSGCLRASAPRRSGVPPGPVSEKFASVENLCHWPASAGMYCCCRRILRITDPRPGLTGHCIGKA